MLVQYMFEKAKVRVLMDVMILEPRCSNFNFVELLL